MQAFHSLSHLPTPWFLLLSKGFSPLLPLGPIVLYKEKIYFSCSFSQPLAVPMVSTFDVIRNIFLFYAFLLNKDSPGGLGFQQLKNCDNGKTCGYLGAQKLFQASRELLITALSEGSSSSQIN